MSCDNCYCLIFVEKCIHFLSKANNVSVCQLNVTQQQRHQAIRIAKVITGKPLHNLVSILEKMRGALHSRIKLESSRTVKSICSLAQLLAIFGTLKLIWKDSAAEGTPLRLKQKRNLENSGQI